MVVVGVGGGADWRCSGDRMVKVLTPVHSSVLAGRVSSLSPSAAQQTDTGTGLVVINQPANNTLQSPVFPGATNQLMFPSRLQRATRIGLLTQWKISD